MSCKVEIFPIFEEDLCGGNKIDTRCVVEESAFLDLAIESNSNQQEINQAVYNALQASKTTADELQQQIDDFSYVTYGIQSIVPGSNITIDDTDPLNPIVSASGGGAVDSVNGQVGVVVLDADDISDTSTTNKFVTSAEKSAITHTNRSILDAITESFTTALKSAYDGAKTNIDALLLTGSRLITNSEITKLINTSGTNTGDQDLSSLAPKASPTLTGVPTAPTAASGTNTTQIATTAFVLANGASKPILVTNATTNGTYNLDWNNDTWDLILTGNTTFTESNLPTSGFTKVISLYVSGNYALTYPANWSTNIIGAYVGTKDNQIVVEYRSTGVYFVRIYQED